MGTKGCIHHKVNFGTRSYPKMQSDWIVPDNLSFIICQKYFSSYFQVWRQRWFLRGWPGIWGGPVHNAYIGKKKFLRVNSAGIYLKKYLKERHFFSKLSTWRKIEKIQVLWVSYSNFSILGWICHKFVYYTEQSCNLTFRTFMGGTSKKNTLYDDWWVENKTLTAVPIRTVLQQLFGNRSSSSVTTEERLFCRPTQLGIIDLAAVLQKIFLVDQWSNLKTYYFIVVLLYQLKITPHKKGWPMFGSVIF